MRWLACIAEDRAFVPWLVVTPTEAELLRARHITPAQINRLEEAWKANPKATVDDIDKPGEDDEPAHVALKCAQVAFKLAFQCYHYAVCCFLIRCYCSAYVKPHSSVDQA